MRKWVHALALALLMAVGLQFAPDNATPTPTTTHAGSVTLRFTICDLNWNCTQFERDPTNAWVQAGSHVEDLCNFELNELTIEILDSVTASCSSGTDESTIEILDSAGNVLVRFKTRARDIPLKRAA